MSTIRPYRISYDTSGAEIESLDLESLGGDLYRLHMSPLFFEGAVYGDIIEADVGTDEVLFFRRVVEKSKFKRFEWVLSKEVVDSSELIQFFDNITEMGGHCEQVFGGVLIVNLPNSCNLDINTELRKVTKNVSRE